MNGLDALMWAITAAGAVCLVLSLAASAARDSWPAVTCVTVLRTGSSGGVGGFGSISAASCSSVPW